MNIKKLVNWVITPEKYKKSVQRQFYSQRGRIKFFACSSGIELGKKVVNAYNELIKEAGKDDSAGFSEKYKLYNFMKEFNDGEINTPLETDVDGADAYVFQSLKNPTYEFDQHKNMWELFVLGSTLHKQRANKITAVLPYLSYSRQDKTTPGKKEKAIAKLVANLIEASGFTGVITWHPHSLSIAEYYNIPFIPFDPLFFFADCVSAYKGDPKVILVGPDDNSKNVIKPLSEELHIPYAIGNKHRKEHRGPELIGMSGDFTGKELAIVIDDMIDSGGTQEAIFKYLHAIGINSVKVVASHGIFSKNAIKILTEAHDKYGLENVCITDTIPQPKYILALPFLTQKSIAEPVALTINRTHYQDSASAPFVKQSEEK